MVCIAVLTTGGGGGLRNKSISSKIFGGASRFSFRLRRLLILKIQNGEQQILKAASLSED